MWTDTICAIHARKGLALPSDLTDAQWAVLAGWPSAQMAPRRLVEARPAGAGVVDSRSVKPTESRGVRGYDADRKIKGRKRQIPHRHLRLSGARRDLFVYIRDRRAVRYFPPRDLTINGCGRNTADKGRGFFVERLFANRRAGYDNIIWLDDRLVLRGRASRSARERAATGQCDQPQFDRRSGFTLKQHRLSVT